MRTHIHSHANTRKGVTLINPTSNHSYVHGSSRHNSQYRMRKSPTYAHKDTPDRYPYQPHSKLPGHSLKRKA